MNKTSLKAIIAKAITGQGNQVDLTGSLDSVLNSIIDELPETLVVKGKSATTTQTGHSWTVDNTAAELAAVFGKILNSPTLARVVINLNNGTGNAPDFVTMQKLNVDEDEIVATSHIGGKTYTLTLTLSDDVVSATLIDTTDA